MMRKIAIHTSVCALFSCALLIATTPASAQNSDALDTIPLPTPAPTPAGDATAADEEQAAVLETIVVTGEKLGRTLDRTTASASVTSGRQMDDYGDDSVFDLMDRVANVTASPEGGFSIRGVGANGADGFGAGQAVIGTYVDGIAIDSVGQSGAILDSFDVDQVEILRGPQSTQQGRSALAGAVIVNTREPTDYWDLRARLRGGDYGERQYAAAGGGPLSDSFSFRLAGDRQQTDGYIPNVTLGDDDWSAQQRTSGRAKLAWRSREHSGLGVLLTGGATEYRENRSLNVENDSEQPQAHRTASDNERGYSINKSTPLSLRVNAPVGEFWTFTSTTGFVDSHQRIRRDLDQIAEDYGVAMFDNKGRNITQELRLRVQDWQALTGVVGIYAGRFDQDLLYQPRNARIYASEVGIPLVGDYIELRVDTEQLTGNEADNLAFFTEFDWAASERLTLTAGLRYDRETRDTVTLYEVTRADATLTTGGLVDVLDQVLGALPPINVLPIYDSAGRTPGSGGQQQSSADYDALLPKLGALYEISETLSLFVTYAQAYRPGGAETIPSTGEQNVFDPEYTSTWETGFRSQLFDDRLQTRFNLYHTRWKDQQVSQPTPDGLSFYTQNAASSTLYGAELESSLRLRPRWNTYLSLGYAHTRFDDYTVGSDDYSGSRFVSAPRLTGSVGTSWHMDWGGFLSTSYSDASDSFSKPDNSEASRSDARRVLDARLGYELGGFRIALYGRNLLDEDYAIYRFPFTPGLGVPEPALLVGYGEPLTLGVQLDIELQ